MTRAAWRHRDGRLLAVFLIGCATLAGCEQRDRPPGGPLAGRAVTLSASLAEDEKAPVQDVLRRFTAETGARVTLVAVAAEDLPDKLAVEVGAGRLSIDLFAQDNMLLRSLVDRGLVEDVSTLALPREVLPALLPPVFAGRRYFLPFRANVQVTYVNRRRFAQAGVEPPRTVEELMDVARRLKAAGGGVPRVTLPLADGGAAAVTIAEWVLAYGGDPLVLNDDGAVRAFEALQGLWQEGLLARESLLAKYDTQVDFLVGETAWLAPNWPFTSGVLAEQDLLQFFQVYPGWRGPARAAHVLGGDVLGTPRGLPSTRREAALALAQFLMGRETQQLLMERNGWPPIRGDVYAEARGEQRETIAAVQAALRDAWARPPVPQWPAVSEAMNEAVRRILVRGEAVRRVLDDLHRRIPAAAGGRNAPGSPAR